MIDTSERPFACLHCHSRFPRADVREKHIKRMHPVDSLDDPTAKKAKRDPQERSKSACDQCRKRKLKCDDHSPCNNCQTRHLACTTSSLRKGPGRPRNNGGIVDGHVVSASDDAFDEATTSETNALLRPSDAEPSTEHPAAPPASPDGGRSGRIGPWDVCFSEAAAASQSRPRAHADGHVYALSEFEASFPPSYEPAFKDMDLSEWKDLDFNFMDGFWELPSLVRLLNDRWSNCDSTRD